MRFPLHMIRVRPVRVEDAEGVVNVLNPLIQAGESTALDRVFTPDEELFAFVRADNVGGLAFYKRIGFEVIGIAKRHAKIKGRYIDEVMIERES